MTLTLLLIHHQCKKCLFKTILFLRCVIISLCSRQGSWFPFSFFWHCFCALFHYCSMRIEQWAQMCHISVHSNLCWKQKFKKFVMWGSSSLYCFHCKSSEQRMALHSPLKDVQGMEIFPCLIVNLRDFQNLFLGFCCIFCLSCILNTNAVSLQSFSMSVRCSLEVKALSSWIFNAHLL